jgi:hypothetical protein
LEKGQAALQGEFSKVLAATVATNSALEELKSMFSSYIGKRLGSEHASPSVSKSALENPMGVTMPGLELPPVFPSPIPEIVSSEAVARTTQAGAERDRTSTSPRKTVSQGNVAAREKGVTDGPSKTKEASVHCSEGEDVSEKPPDKGVSAEDVSLATVGGDSETPDSAGGDGNVAAEDSGKAGALAGALGNTRTSRRRLPRAAAEVMHAVTAIPTSNSDKVEGALNFPMSMNGRGKDKLVIFNVHGTLVDSSLIAEKNPNSKIRPTIRTTTRRVVFRPRLRAFLSRCSLHFSVAFWGSKSAAYMDEVVPAMIGGMSAGSECLPLFVWSAKDCEPVEFEGDTPTAWGKRLAKVYDAWPQFSAHNTLIIDNNKSRISCNLGANVVISKPFYVADLENLDDDKNFLESTLWPTLQLFLSAADVKDFRRKFLGKSPRKDRRRQDLHVHECAIEEVVQVEGEGTREPHGSLMVTSPHFHVQPILNLRICVCRRWRGRKRRSSYQRAKRRRRRR